MSELPPLNIRVNVDATGVATGVSVVTEQMNVITNRAKAATGAFANFRTMAVGMFAGNIMTQGFMGIAEALREAKQEAIDTDSAGQRLKSSLTNIGITSEKTQDKILQNADAYYQLGFQGSEAIRAMGTLVTATGDVSQANKLMALSADYARDKHIDMNSAAIALARATTGNMKAFTAYGITLDKTLPKNEAITKAFDELEKRIGGRAQAYAKSFAGQMDILKEKFDNIVQAIGTKVLPVLNGLLGFLNRNGGALIVLAGSVLTVVAAMLTYNGVMKASKVLQQSYAAWTYAQAASTNVFRFALSSLWTVMKANPIGAVIFALTTLGSLFIWAWNASEKFRRGIAVGIQQIVQGFGYLLGGIAKIARAYAILTGSKYMKKLADDTDKAAISVGKYAKEVLKLSDKKIGGSAPKPFVLPQANDIQGNASVDTTGNKGGGGGSGTVQYVTVYASNTNDIAKKLSKAAKHGTPIGGGK